MIRVYSNSFAMGYKDFAGSGWEIMENRLAVFRNTDDDQNLYQAEFSTGNWQAVMVVEAEND